MKVSVYRHVIILAGILKGVCLLTAEGPVRKALLCTCILLGEQPVDLPPNPLDSKLLLSGWLLPHPPAAGSPAQQAGHHIQQDVEQWQVDEEQLDGTQDIDLSQN